MLCIAAVLLFSNLDYAYLWQDEAATAVLAQRLLRFGRPLAYDGVNLIGIDITTAENWQPNDGRTQDPAKAVSFYVQRGYIKPDTSWKWHPAGQLLVTALSLKMFGPTTLAARLPFAIAGLLTVLILYQFARKRFADPWVATLSTAFLVFNAYWILHMRQCRYYALSSLCLTLALATYARWQSGGRWGALLFGLTAWCWFLVDFGTFIPVIGILFADALIANRRTFWRPLAVGCALALALAPLAFYYQVWRHDTAPLVPFLSRAARNIYNVNEYIAPLAVVAAAGAILLLRWNRIARLERRLVLASCAIVIALLIWVPEVAFFSFLRYAIMAAPAGCLIMAWAFLQLGDMIPRAGRQFALGMAAACIISPFLSYPVSVPIRLLSRHGYRPTTLFRSELGMMAANIFTRWPDPNRIVAQWLKKNAPPDSEIIVNYEDIPLMFYLPNPIRGGIPAFRVEDDSRRPPDFVVLRHSVDFVRWPAFNRELKRYDWIPIALAAPDVAWGNCPDPMMREPTDAPPAAKTIFIARRREAPAGQ